MGKSRPGEFGKRGPACAEEAACGILQKAARHCGMGAAAAVGVTIKQHVTGELSLRPRRGRRLPSALQTPRSPDLPLRHIIPDLFNKMPAIQKFHVTNLGSKTARADLL